MIQVFKRFRKLPLILTKDHIMILLLFFVGEYLLVTEYAEGGTLHNYLKENFSSLNWRDKYRLAFQLSSAIEYLHEKEIVHKDLHSKNILIQQNSIDRKSVV